MSSARMALSAGTTSNSSRDLGLSLADKLFIDPDHLTATGGDLFSKAVVQGCFERSSDAAASGELHVGELGQDLVLGDLDHRFGIHER